jgi:hypothetical protein
VHHDSQLQRNRNRLKQNEYAQVQSEQYNLNIDRRWDSFKGFLYAPLLVRHNIVWSLRATTVTGDKKYALFAVHDQNLPVTGIKVANQTHLIIPVAGVYYLTLTAQFCALPTLCCVAGLYANNNMLFKTPPLKFNSHECFLHNRAVLLPLGQNDVLYVVAMEGGLIGSLVWINLSGFLVHAT